MKKTDTAALARELHQTFLLLVTSGLTLAAYLAIAFVLLDAVQ